MREFGVSEITARHLMPDKIMEKLKFLPQRRQERKVFLVSYVFSFPKGRRDGVRTSRLCGKVLVLSGREVRHKTRDVFHA